MGPAVLVIDMHGHHYSLTFEYPGEESKGTRRRIWKMRLREPEAPIEHGAPISPYALPIPCSIKVGEAALIALRRIVWHCYIASVENIITKPLLLAQCRFAGPVCDYPRVRVSGAPMAVWASGSMLALRGRRAELSAPATVQDIPEHLVPGLPPECVTHAVDRLWRIATNFVSQQCVGFEV